MQGEIQKEKSLSYIENYYYQLKYQRTLSFMDWTITLGLR